jgi:hypothetical protein
MSMRWTVLIGLTLASASCALVFASTSTEGGAQDSLQGSVGLSNRGPLHLCQTVPDPRCQTWHLIYIKNANQITGDVTAPSQFRARQFVQNAFVVSSVDQSIFADGELYQENTYTPPPNANPTAYSGNWPSTVRCVTSPPCDVVLSPAILPGEKTAAVIVGWAHVTGEPSGKYVFRYTVHGTVNGGPVDVTTSTPPIVMSD